LHGLERFHQPIESISKFDSQIYSEEVAPVSSEREYDEVMSLMAEDDSAWQAYEQWSRDNEESAWHGSRTFNTQHGQILIKKACEHQDCPHTECSRSYRVGGIEI
jgi:hypothetical protein